MLFKEALRLVCSEKMNSQSIENPFWLYAKVSDICKDSKENAKLLKFYNIDKTAHIFYVLNSEQEKGLEKLLNLYPNYSSLLSKRNYEEIINFSYDILNPGWLEQNGLDYPAYDKPKIQIVRKKKEKEKQNQVKSVEDNQKPKVKKINNQNNAVKVKQPKVKKNTNGKELYIYVRNSKLQVYLLDNLNECKIEKTFGNTITAPVISNNNFDEIRFNNTIFQNLLIPKDKYRKINLVTNNSIINYSGKSNFDISLNVKSTNSKLQIFVNSSEINFELSNTKTELFNYSIGIDAKLTINSANSSIHLCLEGYRNVNFNVKETNTELINYYHEQLNYSEYFYISGNDINGKISIISLK